MDSRALTKIQSAALISIIVIAAVGGVAGYVSWRASLPPPEDIRIGVCADLDMPNGKATYRGVVLAVEQINAEGGILGKNLTVVAEDDDSGTPPYDIAVATNALTKLITVDKADYVVTSQPWPTIMAYQDLCAEQKKILISVYTTADNYTQRVLENYDKYKYFFRVLINDSAIVSAALDGVLTVGNYTGFKKIAYLGADTSASRSCARGLDSLLPKYGYEFVYSGIVPPTLSEFASYFSAIEASGAEILQVFLAPTQAVPFAKEYHERQSPLVVWGSMSGAQEFNFLNLTQGKCEYVSFVGSPIVARIPFTNKTIAAHDAFVQRWGERPKRTAGEAYDSVRFILYDAIKRAGTAETEAVIKALERTDVETSSIRRFTFTSSHDVMIEAGQLDRLFNLTNIVNCLFQWQNGTQVPVYPEDLMKEVGATYQYPPWTGPWSNKQTP